MKKILLSLALVGIVLFATTGCGKEKTCRCAVIGQQTVRLVQLEKGDCRDIRFVYYDESLLYPNVTDSVICTDYEFSEE